MEGLVFSIEEFSVYDGPGIRTTVFLKGCPLRCNWCHNPEGQNAWSEIVRSPNGCLECGACVKHAVVQNGQRVFTQDSIQACPLHLLRVCGEKTDSDTLCAKLLKNQIILKNGGGVTFSGGEPLMQSAFLFECLQQLQGKLHTAIQTCGFCDGATFDTALSLADYILYDLKLADDAAHQRYTGVSNAPIRRNFTRLANSGKDFVVRIPLIPGVTDTEENITQIATLLAENRVSYAELLPYNTMAGGKYKMLQREYRPLFDEKVPVHTHEAIFDSFGIRTKTL